MQRRGFLAGSAALIGSGAATCSRAATSTTLRFVPQADLSSIDPIWTTATVPFNHGMMVYDTLYAVDASFTPQPQMVAGHEVSDDKLTWIFTLRDGLFFHDNGPVRSVDCVASINRWGKRKGFGQKLLSLTNEMRVLDDKRFQIRLKSPFPQMPFALGGPEICFIMPQRSAEVDPFKQITDPVGSGPFRYLADERVSGSFTAYAKWEKYQPRPEKPSYWAGGKAVYVDRVEWRVLPDGAVAANALMRGEVDWVENPVLDLIPMLRKQPNVQLVAIAPLGFVAAIAVNHTQPPFNNGKLLQAILPAIDQTEYMTAVVGDEAGLRMTPCGFFTPGTPAANKAELSVLTGKRDLELAKRLVAESGYKGEKVVLMAPADQVLLMPMAQVTASLFQAIGINVDFQNMDWATLVSRRASDKPAPDGGWNAFCSAWGGNISSNPGSHFPLRGNGKGGWFGWPDSPTLEGLRDRWFVAPDAAAQLVICEQMQSIAMKEVPYIPLGAYRMPSALSRSLQGAVLSDATLFWGVSKT